MSEAAIQLNLLEENIDLKAIPFDESALILSKFLQQYATEMCEKRQFSGEFLRWTTETLALRLTPGKIPAVAELRQTRANTWELYHAELTCQTTFSLRSHGLNARHDTPGTL